MHAFEIREKRFRLQQAAGKLEEGDPDRLAFEQQVVAIQMACPHEHPEEDTEKGWRCRDCDLTRPPEPTEQVAQEAAVEAEPTEQVVQEAAVEPEPATAEA